MTHAHNGFDVNHANKVVSKILGVKGIGQFVKDEGKKVTARLQIEQLPDSLRQNSLLQTLRPNTPIKIQVPVGEDSFCLECTKRGNTLLVSTKHPQAVYSFLNPDWKSLTEAR